MKAVNLFENVTNEECYKKLKDIEITGVTADSRKVKKGDIFIAIKGGKLNGQDYAEEALKKGASIVVSEEDLALENQVIVEDARKAYSLICKNFNKKACEKLKIIAITGTNGKTTTTHLLKEVLFSLGKKVASVGTLGAEINGNKIDTGLTTPDPDMLHKLFKDMVEQGVEYCVMEASAHAIALKKLEGIKFEVVVLTNITQDHLDFFKTMDNYAKVKMSIFDKNHCRFGIVCSDDAYAQTLIDNENINIPIVSYGLDNPADCFAINIESSAIGCKFFVNCVDDLAEIETQLAGKYNVENLLAVITVLRSQGFLLEDFADKIKDIAPAKGRFNILKNGEANVIIDYAHTPDGLENLLKSVREITKGRVITVFGCGGNRDATKRPIMGAIASKYSDYCLITSDNPRFEKPMSIIHEIARGASGNYSLIQDRAEAIKIGLRECKKDDTLVIAGKGAEEYQETEGHQKFFSDFEEVLKYTSLRKYKLGDEINDS